MKKRSFLLFFLALLPALLLADPGAQCFSSFTPVSLFRDKAPFSFYKKQNLFPDLSNGFHAGFSFLQKQQSGFPAMRMNYSAPPLPFFCSMENKMQKRFDIWIKFRAGTDADYMKLIADPQKRYAH